MALFLAKNLCDCIFLSNFFKWAGILLGESSIWSESCQKEIRIWKAYSSLQQETGEVFIGPIIHPFVQVNFPNSLFNLPQDNTDEEEEESEKSKSNVNEDDEEETGEVIFTSHCF